MVHGSGIENKLYTKYKRKAGGIEGQGWSGIDVWL